MTPSFTVFVVEDERIFAMLFEQVLGQLPNVAVKCFTSMAELLEHGGKPDLLVLDYMVEDGDALSVFPLLRQQFGDTHIVMVSGQLEVEVVAEAYRSGVAKYFRKDQQMMSNLQDYVKELQNLEPATASVGSKLLSFLGLGAKAATGMTLNTVFVVEDDDGAALVIEDVLRKQGARDIHRFRNGKSCLEALSMGPDLILLDYFLPDMNGLRVLEQIRDAQPKTPVLVVTGQEEVDVAIQLFELGIVSYVAKEGEWYQTLSKLLAEQVG